ncbi:MAG: DUF6440 family protein [Eubacteriales bacterium]|nr:DUF6440 family protein [Eubacteriales bacterium]
MSDKENERFVRTYKQGGGFCAAMEIWVDRQTGVNYLYRESGYSGGLSPLLDTEGKPVVTPLSDHWDQQW